jgi:hypothetical protein
LRAILEKPLFSSPTLSSTLRWRGTSLALSSFNVIGGFMFKPRAQSYFSTLVITMATLGFILQACGKAKPLTADSSARAQTAKKDAGASSAQLTIAQTSSNPMELAQELQFKVAGDAMDVKIAKASKTDVQSGQTTASANLDLVINNIDLGSITLTNTKPDDNSQGIQYSASTAFAAQAALPYDIEAKGYIDFQNPDLYYVIVTMTKNGQTGSGATQEFGVIISSSAVANLKAGVLILDNPGIAAGTQDDSFIGLMANMASGKSAKSVASGISDAAPELPFTLGTDAMDIKIAQTAQVTVVSPTDVVSDVYLTINNLPVSIHSEIDVTDSKNPRITSKPAYPSTLGYDLTSTCTYDFQNTHNLYVFVSLTKSGATVSPDTARGFIFAIGNSNPQLSTGMMMLDKEFPVGGDADVSASRARGQALVDNMLAKFQPASASTQTPSAAAPTAATAQAAAPAASAVVSNVASPAVQAQASAPSVVAAVAKSAASTSVAQGPTQTGAKPSTSPAAPQPSATPAPKQAPAVTAAQASTTVAPNKTTAATPASAVSANNITAKGVVAAPGVVQPPAAPAQKRTWLGWIKSFFVSSTPATKASSPVAAPQAAVTAAATPATAAASITSATPSGPIQEVTSLLPGDADSATNN